jgi:late competence protein required for DNA uptake (superfamily II DNA/RNA helicase)
MPKSTVRRRKNGNNNQVLEAKLPEVENEDVLVEQLNFEIECPRCSDVMELSSEFDYLSYYCRGCHLELRVH